MSPLRQRFIDDMRLRNLSPQTIEAYVHAVTKFAKHYKKSPEQLGPDQIREYQLHLINQNVSWSQFNQCACALRFHYNTTLKRPHIIRHLPFAKRLRTLADSSQIDGDRSREPNASVAALARRVWRSYRLR